jgi:putative membrane protein
MVADTAEGYPFAVPVALGGGVMQINELKSPAEKAAYVAGVTTIFTFLGCWAVLAHSSGNAGPRPSVNDELFAKKTAQGMIAEVKMGQLAASKGSSEAVRNFGKKMVDEQTQSQDVLKDVAQKLGIGLPAEMDSKQRAAVDDLSKLSGAAFDKTYTRLMVKVHQDDVAEFTSEASGGQKSAMRSFASENLPSLKEHLKLARDLKQSTITASAAPAPAAKAPAAIARKSPTATKSKRGK